MFIIKKVVNFFAETLVGVLALITITAATAQTPISNPSQPSQLFGLLQEMGFNILNVPASDFELPMVLNGAGNGSKVGKLSDYKGRWLWVVFWATWCGPCVQEMPSLESLYQEQKDKNFSVVGVTVDQGDQARPGIQRFLREKRITFPNFHDVNSEVSKVYQSSAVPSIYLISPDWRLVGIFRGANNWDTPEVISGVTRLLAFKQAGTELPAAVAASAAAASAAAATAPTSDASEFIPKDLIPPEIKMLPLSKGKGVGGPESSLLDGDVVTVQLQVKWKGALDRYIMRVPRLTLPEGFVQENVSSNSYSEGDNTSILLYDFKVRFDKGKLKSGTGTIGTTATNTDSVILGPCEVAYQARSFGEQALEKHPLYSRSDSISVAVVVGSDTGRGWWILLGGLVLLILMASFYWWYKFYRHERGKRLGEDFLSPQERERKVAVEELKQIYYEDVANKRTKSDRKSYEISLLEFYVGMESRVKKFGEFAIDDERKRELERSIERIRYGGECLKEEELSFYRREIERFLNNSDN
ncbi:MAG: TlpA family protein disulfide reductase [Oligoflexia bacterium]|nr:TlpA family protein disulfide reductase [Oligoflexia bacterium]